MSTYELRTLEERLAAIEEKVGIEGAKTLQQAADEEAERVKEAAAQEYRAKYAPREIWSKARLDKMMMTTIIVFCDSIDDSKTREAVEYMHRTFRSRSNGQYYGITRNWGYVERSWGFWEKSNPQFQLSDDELSAYTGGKSLPVALLPNRDPNSSETTLMALGNRHEGEWRLLDKWFEENRGKMSY